MVEKQSEIHESQKNKEETNNSEYSLHFDDKLERPTRSKSLVFIINNDASRMTTFKSKHFDLPELLNETVINSRASSGFNLVIKFEELLFSLKNDLIASGGYGDVYKGKWLGLQVAIKKFGKKYVSKKALKELVKEIEMLHALRHPNIVLYMGVSFDKYNQYYMITEFVTKGSLFYILHKKYMKLPEKVCYTIAKQIAIAMNYLHQKGKITNMVLILKFSFCIFQC